MSDDPVWVLTDVQETVEEKTVTLAKADDGNSLMGVMRRRVARFTYVRKSAGAYDFSAHNTETDLTGGATETRCTEYSATIDPITTGIEETKTEIDQTVWKLAYTYTVSSFEGGE